MRRRAALAVAACTIGVVAAVGFFAQPLGLSDATHVVAVHAGGGDVPSNLLRVYVEFSAPMAPGDAYSHLRLVDERGNVVNDAFLELREELWSSDNRRLTLLFDPGRVKRGIRANEEMGAPLVAGHRYRLVVDSTWRDSHGRPLRRSYEQELRVTGFDSTPPDPSRWSISTPERETREPLRVSFGEPLDHALALRLISLVDSSGLRVPGRALLADDDRAWTFIPDAEWSATPLLLRIDPAVEDLAGNNLTRPFDADRARAGGIASAEVALADTFPRRIPLKFRDRGR